MNRLKPERIAALLDRASRIRVLVVGDAMLDVYLRGAASRISPEAPVPVVHVHEEWRALGGAANVAANVVALGAACEIVGCVGADRAGDELRHEVTRAGIDPGGLVALERRRTTVKTRVMARNQQVVRFDVEEDSDIDEVSERRLVAAIAERASRCDVIVLEDYDKGVLARPVIAAAIEAGRAHDLPIVVDPKARHFFDYVGVTIFKPNQGELAAALRSPVRADDPEWMDRTRRQLACAHLLVTLGEDGMALMTDAGEFVRVPTTARSVYDVSGAGDTVTAVVAVAIGAGADPAEAAVLANHAAGIEVGKAGVTAVSADELMEEILQHHAP